jgi:WD40 repeat protein
MTVGLGLADTDWQSRNPFPGLRPFLAGETHLFFGRDEPTDELIGQLGESSFLAVVGVSGSGKSSLVKCGVLPALYGGFLADAGSNWRVAMFRPGNDPIGNLAAALADPDVLGSAAASGGNADMGATIMETVLRRGSLGLADAVRQARLGPRENLLVVADQFEELFRFKQSMQAERPDDEAAAFVKLLVEAARTELPVYVMITMRSDFLGDCAQFRDLPEAINEGLYLIPRMTRDQQREAIEGPVAMAGAQIAPRLVQRLLNDVGDNPDQLPILQHALMRTWDRWASETRHPESIDLSDYETVGRMEGALDQHLDEVLDGVTEGRPARTELRDIAKRMFQTLTEKEEDNRAIRRPATVDEICTVAEAEFADVATIIEEFRAPGRTFLMPPHQDQLTGDTLIDISHESLIRNWTKLRGWVENDAEHARVYRALSEAAESWKTVGHSPYQGPVLQRALDWWETWGGEDAARAWTRPFDERSRRPQGFQHAKEFLMWSERERIKRFRRRVGAGGAGLAALVFWALVSTATARFEARAQLIELAATRPDPLEGSLILAELQNEESFIWRLASRIWRPLGRKRDRADGRGVEVALDLAQQAIPAAAPLRHSSPVRELVFDANGKRVLTLFDDDTAELVDAETGESLQLPSAIDSAQGRIKNLFFVDDSTFAFYDEDSMLRIAGGASFQIPRGRDYSAFSPGGKRFLALYSDPGIVCVWTLDHAARTSGGGSEVGNDRTDCQAAIDGGSAEVEQPPSSVDRQALVSLVFRHESVVMAHFSRDGTRLATRSYAEENGLRGWNLDTGDEIGRASNEAVLDVAISGGSGRPLLATAHFDGVARVRELRGDSAVARCELDHEGPVESISFDRAGTRVLTASEDGLARVWDVGADACPPPADSIRQPRSLHTLAGREGGLAAAYFGPEESEVVALSSTFSTVRRWRVEAGERPRVLQVLRGPPARAVALSGDGRLIATGGARGDVRIYRTAGTKWFTEPADAEAIWHVAVAPDGSRFATAHPDSTVRFWDRDGEPVGTRDTLDGTPTSLAFAPDGRLVAAVGATTVVWEAGGEATDQTLTNRAEVQSFGFDETAGYILAGLVNGWAELWDAAERNVIDSINAGEGRRIEAVARNRSGVTATGDGWGKLRIWTRTGDPAGLDTVFSNVRFLAFSPDGRSLAAVTGDTVRVRSLKGGANEWRTGDLEDWREWKLPGAVGLHFVSDTTLLTATEQGAVQTWHASRGDPLLAFDAGAPPLSASAVAANGSVVATYHFDDEAVRLWPTGYASSRRTAQREWQGLLRYLRERTSACLDSDQRRTGLGEEPGEAQTREGACRTRYQTKLGENR